MFKAINHDIKVSWVFTLLALAVVLSIIVLSLIEGDFSFSRVTLFYGLPFSLLAIFFSRTAERKDLDQTNQKAIQSSFYVAMIITIISLIWLLFTAI